MRRILGIVGLSLALGCSALNPSIQTEKMRLSIAATGARPVPMTAIGTIPVPIGGALVAVLFDIYAGPFIERYTELDHCRLVTTQEPPDLDTVTGAIIVTATAICRLGPSKVRVREIVTLTLEPVAEG